MADLWTGWVGGRRLPNDQSQPGVRLVVRHPYDGTPVAEVAWATADQVEQAVAAADTGRAAVGGASAYVRAEALAHVSARLAERAEEVARLVTAESGKPITWSRVEVARAVSTFRWGAEEARRFGGEVQRHRRDEPREGRCIGGAGEDFHDQNPRA